MKKEELLIALLEAAEADFKSKNTRKHLSRRSSDYSRGYTLGHKQSAYVLLSLLDEVLDSELDYYIPTGTIQ